MEYKTILLTPDAVNSMAVVLEYDTIYTIKTNELRNLHVEQKKTMGDYGCQVISVYGSKTQEQFALTVEKHNIHTCVTKGTQVIIFREAIG